VFPAFNSNSGAVASWCAALIKTEIWSRTTGIGHPEVLEPGSMSYLPPSLHIMLHLTFAIIHKSITGLAGILHTPDINTILHAALPAAL
jgi:hypothetical protein